MSYKKAGDYYNYANEQKLVNSHHPITENKKTNFKSEMTIYQYQSCEECPLKQKCITAKGDKKMYVFKNFIQLREESIKNIKNNLEMCLKINQSI